MKTRGLWIGWLTFLFSLSFGACTPPPQISGEGGPCQVQGDCETGLRCSSRLCKKPPVNKPPVAEGRLDPSPAKVGERIFLDASRSRDEDNDPLEYTWVVDSRPDASKAEPESPKQSRTYFVADKPGTYRFQLVVDDGKAKVQLAAPLELVIEAAPNDAPIADAGRDQSVAPGSAVTLDGSASQDPNSDPLAYKWTLKTIPPGSKATLDKDDTAAPTLKTDLEGRYVVELVVTDARGLASIPDSMTVQALVGFDKTPSLTSVSPTSASTEAILRVTLKGSNFVAGARVSLGVRRYETRLVSDTELSSELDLSGVTPRTYDLTVINPNNKTSQAVPFEVKDIPTPEITALTPNLAGEGVKVNLVITGKGFLQESEILFQTTSLKTVYKSATELSAELDLKETLQGEYEIFVRNPAGRRSQASKFTVLPLGVPPTVRVLNPPFGKTKAKLPFSVHGTGFEAGAEILFDGKPIASDRIRRDEIQAKPELDLSNVSPGSYKVAVRNPNGQTSNAIDFLVEETDPTPLLDRILPFNIFLGEKITIALYGQSFQSGLKVFFDNIELKDVTFKSTTFIEAKVDTTAPGWGANTYKVTVLNPNGKRSNAFDVIVAYRQPVIESMTPEGWANACDTTVTIRGRYFIPTSSVYFGTFQFTAGATDPGLKLTYVNDTELRFPLKATSLIIANYKVYVSNDKNSESTKVDFSIQSKEVDAVGIDGMTPSGAPAGSVVTVEVDYDFTLADFKPGAVVQLNGVSYPTLCDRFSATSTYCYLLIARLDLANVAPGKYPLTVINPCGTPSAPVDFNVLPPIEPIITGFRPNTIKAGAKERLKILGQDFSSKAAIYYNNQKIDTTAIAADELETKTEIDFTTAGEFDVYVDNGTGKRSVTVKFTVLPATATLTLLNLSETAYQRGKNYINITAQGTGFTANSKVQLNGVEIPATYVSPGQIDIPNLNFQTQAPGPIYLQVKDGANLSNRFLLYVRPVPPPNLLSLSPSSVVLGKATKPTIYMYGDNFCESTSTFTRCPVNPIVEIIDPDGADISSSFTITYAYPDDITGTFDLTGRKAGDYSFYLKHPTGEKSSPAIFSIKPPPAPALTGLSPTFAFRGNPTQSIKLLGSNLVTGDIVIFNNEVINQIPGTANSTGSELSFTTDLSKYKVAKTYPIFVIRCKNANCTQTEQTTPINIELRNPPCGTAAGAIQCSTLPAPAEVCDTTANQCRPACTADPVCQAFQGAPANFLCRNASFCAPPAP